MSKRITANDQTIGARIRMHRMHKGISQEKLGDALGITFQQVQKYERGTNRISASRLFEVAHCLNIPVGQFYEDLAPGHRAPLANGADVPAATKFLTLRESPSIIAAVMALPGKRSRVALIEVARAMGPA